MSPRKLVNCNFEICQYAVILSRKISSALFLPIISARSVLLQPVSRASLCLQLGGTRKSDGIAANDDATAIVVNSTWFLLAVAVTLQPEGGKLVDAVGDTATWEIPLNARKAASLSYVSLASCSGGIFIPLSLPLLSPLVVFSFCSLLSFVQIHLSLSLSPLLASGCSLHFVLCLFHFLFHFFCFLFPFLCSRDGGLTFKYLKFSYYWNNFN